MNYGWVSIHRQIQEHWLWEDKPFSYGQAWIDLILLANHANNKFALGKEIVTVEAGSFITSEYKLADRWGWSKTKVRNYLQLLQNDQMILKKSDHKKTIITIVNYTLFQDSETTEKLQKNYKKTTEKLLKNLNNNDNNKNNINNIIYAENPELNKAIIDFVDFRQSINKPMTDRAITIMINKLNKMTSDVTEQVDIINQSIMNGWQGIFPLKNKEKAKRKEVVPDWMKKGKKQGFNDYKQNDYDFEEIEREILRSQERTTGNDPDLKERAEALKKKLGGN